MILGDPQYFFDGNQTDQHGCKCKQDNSCKTAFGNEFGCNCNARLPEWNIDKGTITGQSLSKALLLRMYIRGFTELGITMGCGLKFHWYLRTLSLKFHKAT